jgi:ATP phosphoribosyltransferase
VDEDKTVELVTNLDRAAIEAKLREIVAEAQRRKLDDITTLIGNFAGMSQDELRRRVALCIQALARSAEHRALFAQLELVELNLPNLG